MIRYKEIFLGKQCNNKCLYCRQKLNNIEQIDYGDITADLDQKNSDSVAFFGGEPTLRKDLIGLITTAKRNGYRRIKLVSNGRNLSDSRALFQIVEAGCNLFEIKLLGSNPDTHCYLTQTPDSFHQTVQGLENLRRLPVDTFACLRIPICRQNLTDLTNTTIMGINLGVDRIILALEDNNLPIKDLLPHLKMAVNVSILNRIWIQTEGLPYCTMPGLEHHVGEVYHGSDSAIYPRTYQHHENCQQCVFQKFCNGIETETLNNFGPDAFPPIKENQYLEDIRALYS